MDIVADSLIRIKNGYLASKEEVNLSYSKLIQSICKLLEEEGFIEKAEVKERVENKNIKDIVVTLKYQSRKPALKGVKRISKPGLRVYKGSKALPYVLNGLGVAIISTPKGVLSDKRARKEGVGGEILAHVW
jgi:small subunit ribosomal protein S8